MCGPHHCLGRDAFASGPEILNASILEQGCSGVSPGSANRKHQITRHPWRTSSPLRPSLSFRYTQVSAAREDVGDLIGTAAARQGEREQDPCLLRAEILAGDRPRLAQIATPPY